MASELVEHSLGSAILGNERAVHLGRRPGATQAVVLLDAEYFLQMPSLASAFDGNRPPTHLALVSAVDPRTRWIESFCNESFVTFLAEELVPWLREATDLPTEAPVHLGGLSLTGLAALHTAWRAPETFRTVLALSPSLWWEDERLLALCAAEPSAMPPTSILVGDDETAAPVDHGDRLVQRVSQVDACRSFRDLLVERGAALDYREYPGGHALADWERELPDAYARLLALAGEA